MKDWVPQRGKTKHNHSAGGPCFTSVLAERKTEVLGRVADGAGGGGGKSEGQEGGRG